MDVMQAAMPVTASQVRYPCYMVIQQKEREWRWIYYSKDRRKIAESARSYPNKKDALHAVFLIKASGGAPVF